MYCRAQLPRPSQQHFSTVSHMSVHGECELDPGEAAFLGRRELIKLIGIVFLTSAHGDIQVYSEASSQAHWC